jgi:hypothetical protein
MRDRNVNSESVKDVGTRISFESRSARSNDDYGKEGIPSGE